MRVEAMEELEKAKIPKSNLSAEEWKALKSLKIINQIINQIISYALSDIEHC